MRTAIAARALARSGMALAVLLATTLAVHAQDVQSFPNKAVRIVVPKAPGGIDDSVARLVAQQLQAVWKQPVLIENRPGAAAITGAVSAIKSAPDGYTLLFINSVGQIVAGAMKEPAPYDPVKDFVPVSVNAIYTSAWIVSTTLAVKSMSELIAHAKANPGKLHFGSSGYGSLPQLAVELLMQQTGTKMIHVPYKGGGEAIVGLASRQIAVYLTDLNTALGGVKRGDARALAQSGFEKSPLFPDVPLINEAGLEELQKPRALGLVAPPGTPAGLVAKINADVNRAMADPDIRQKAEAMGVQIVAEPASSFGTIIANDVKIWSPIAKALAPETSN